MGCARKYWQERQEQGEPEPKQPCRTWDEKQGKAAQGKKKRASDWYETPLREWTRYQFWYWFSSRLEAAGYPVYYLRHFDKQDWVQLAKLWREKGQEIQRLYEICRRLVRSCDRLDMYFKWERKPFRPGRILAYWDTLVTYTVGVHGSMLPEDYQISADVSCEPKVKIPSMPEGSPECRCRLGKNGKVLVRDWKRRRRGTWTVSTIWAFIEDYFHFRGVPTKRLTTSRRKKLEELVAEYGVDSVYQVACCLVEYTPQVYAHFDWDGPLDPAMISGFWKGLYALAREHASGALYPEEEMRPDEEVLAEAREREQEKTWGGLTREAYIEQERLALEEGQRRHLEEYQEKMRQEKMRQEKERGAGKDDNQTYNTSLPF